MVLPVLVTVKVNTAFVALGTVWTLAAVAATTRLTLLSTTNARLAVSGVCATPPTS